MIVRPANLGAKFLLELAALAAFAYRGSTVGDRLTAVVPAVAAPALIAVLWSRYAAPRARRRLGVRARIPFELSVFALASVLKYPAGGRVLAVVLAACVALNDLLLTGLRQWEH